MNSESDKSKRQGPNDFKKGLSKLTLTLDIVIQTVR